MMSNNHRFAAKRVYPSEQGLHFELYTEAEAQAAYKDAKSRGINNVVYAFVTEASRERGSPLSLEEGGNATRRLKPPSPVIYCLHETNSDTGLQASTYS